jgi:chitodextrinase
VGTIYALSARFARRHGGLLMGLIACAALAVCGGGDSQDESLAQNATASLAWDASSGVTGYRLYYGTVSHTYQQARGSGIAVGNATSHTVSGLKGATRYYFAVTAVDRNGNESPFSNEVSKKIP